MIEEDVPFAGSAMTTYGPDGAMVQHQAARADMIDVETTRAQAETQAGFLVAKQFPRNENSAIQRIVGSCQRKTLAEQAVYAFPRGGQQVTGPSIRLAEVLAQQWGNINFGYREIAEAAGVTQVLAYAYDLETNTRAEKMFHVKHTIDTKNGPRTLTSRRDIYEQIANQASRRIRSCILQVIPGDVCETAMEACEVALEAAESEDLPARRKKAVASFKEFNVTEKMIETRFETKIHALLPADLVVLRRIYQGLRDGMTTVGKWFDDDATEKAKTVVKKATKKKAAAKPKAEAKKAPEPAPEPEAPEAPPGVPDEPEAAPEPQEEAEKEELDDDAIQDAIAIDTKGRVSNFSNQLQNIMADAMSHMIEMGEDENEAIIKASRVVYNVMSSGPFECEQLGSMPLSDRAEFITTLREWADGFTK